MNSKMQATPKQRDFLEILFNDVGIDTRAKRNDFISIRIGREIKFLDELTKSEASTIIAAMKLKKAEESNLRDKSPDWNQE